MQRLDIGDFSFHFDELPMSESVFVSNSNLLEKRSYDALNASPIPKNDSIENPSNILEEEDISNLLEVNEEAIASVRKSKKKGKPLNFCFLMT